MSVHEAGLTQETTTATDGPSSVATYPLTPMQFGLSLESIFGERPSVNVEQVVCRFDGEQIDPKILAAAWTATQLEHEALRTWLELDGDDGPVQHVHADARSQLEVLDRIEDDPSSIEDGLAAWLRADRAEGVRPDRPGAMRLVLIRRPESCPVMVWTFHHSLLDGRSFALVLEELFERYEELERDGRMAVRVQRPMFREHIDALERLDRTAAREYFSDLLAGHDEVHGAPGATGNPLVERRYGDGAEAPRHHREHELRLTTELTESIRRRAESVDATIGTFLLVGWSMLLARYGSTTDVVFGSTRVGRHSAPGADEMVGCLINTVPFRVQPLPELRVDDLLRTTRSAQLDVRPFEQTSLVDIHSWSDLSGNQPLVETSVVFERELLQRRIRGRSERWANRTVVVLEESSFPLELSAYLDDGLLLRLQYDTERYRPEVIATIGEHLECLLESLAAAGPSTLVGEVEMLPEAERARLLIERNPAPWRSQGSSYIDLFEAQVVRRPDALAVSSVGDAEQATYSQLDERANRLSHLLVEAGTAPDQPVAICLPRSIGFVASVLATFKADAAYLPLDPSYPTSSLLHMLEDSGARVVVTDSVTAARLPPLDARVLLIDELDDELASAPAIAPSRGARDADDLAYVIYTSGSTGRPKGVMVSQRSLVDFCVAIAERYDLEPRDRVLQYCSLSFDVSIEEMLPTLASGASLVLRNEDLASSMGALVDSTRTHDLTVLNLPSAVWHALVDHLVLTGARLSPAVRLVVVGGEKVSRLAYETWVDLHPEIAWLNGYGPTETTVTCSTFDPVGRYRVGSGDELPIGRPLDTARVYLLDAAGIALVPDGQVGDLWVGGTGVALGYLGRPDLTSECFRPDPFAGVDGARMYRTGDRARWLPSGDLQFHGRSDRQIKLRGFRLEPGEIEHAIELHPDVRQAFVSLRPSPSGDTRLVAWLVPDEAQVGAAGSVDIDGLSAQLSATLPAHAVPSALVVVDELARTPAGKVDVDVLPTPVRSNETVGQADLPHNDGERRLCRLFADVLAISPEAVGVERSFFDLGGHSLLAVRLIGRLEVEFGTRISLATLHDAATPRALAARLGQDDGDRGHAFLSSIQPLGARPPLYAVHVLGSNGSYYRPLARRLGDDQPVFGVSIIHPDGATPTEVVDIAALYVAEIERHQPTGPLSLSGISLGGYVAFEVAQQLTAHGREVRILVLLDSDGPGGRVTVHPFRRIAIHGRKLLSERSAYVVEMFRNQVEALKGLLATLRVRAHRRLSRTPPADLWQHQFVMANVAASETYVARPYSGKIVLVHAEGELFDHPESVRDGLGWQVVAAGGLEVIDVPGQHMSMLEEPNVATLALELRRALDGDGTEG